MKLTRRNFLSTGLFISGLGANLPSSAADPAAANRSAPAGTSRISDDALERAGAQPILNLHGFKEPVVIESIELLRKGGNHLLRVRSEQGAEGIAVDNGRIGMLYPILHQLVIPYFVGKDARELEAHLFEVYRYKSNYKLQGMAFWSPIALVEFALLDLLGRVSGSAMGDLLGGVVRERVPFYVASSRRDTTPEQEVKHLQRLIAETGAKAVKYRVGGRMNRNQDSLPGRTESLIRLSREALGDGIAIHADSNSSYDATEAIRVGRLLEDINAVFFEEPCPFDDFRATKRVADELNIPVALGEQESSEWRFQHTIREHVADIMQPDLFYYGGLIRSTRVARMAALRDIPTAVHISGGFGFVYMLHFASCVPKIGQWQEYKEGVKQYGEWFSPPLRISDGAITVPKGPGVGIADPKEILKDAEIVKPR